MYFSYVATRLLSTLCVLQVVAATSSSSSSSPIASTCPARTVNYITHKLPQQCPMSSRSPSVSPTTTTSTTDHPQTASQTERPVPERHETVQSAEASSSAVTSNTNPSVGVGTDAENAITVTADSGTPVTIVSATAISSSTQIAYIPAVIEEDSALEGGNFLSFEDWKKQNQIKASQSEQMGRSADKYQRSGRKLPSAVHGALDSLGDDAEIDLDFGGLVSPGLQADGLSKEQALPSSSSEQVLDVDAKPRTSRRSKDAGKTSKQRFNYASFDCAANILKSNSQAKHPTSVLIENKDAYMLNECSAEHKFLILELCQDLSIDTIVLANYEYFSSIFRQFRVSVSNLYPVKADKWITLGTFEARNTREIQAFLIENPVIWARYVKIEFLTHYGNEYYCPVSLVRVHGTTMLEEYKHDQEVNANDDDDDDEVEQVSIETPVAGIPSLVTPPGQHEVTDSSTPVPSESNAAVQEKIVISDQTYSADAGSQSPSKSHASSKSSMPRESISPATSNLVMNSLLLRIASQSQLVCPVDDFDRGDAQGLKEEDHPKNSNVSAMTVVTQTTSILQSTTSSTAVETKVSSDSALSSGSSQPATQSSGTATSIKSIGESATPSSSSLAKVASQASTRAKQSTSSAAERKPSGSGTQAAPASPTMQESFFRSVQKRLQMLESNSSLSLQYIEEQSRSLQEAFRKVEQRQLLKTTAFLNHLNHTVLNELREFRQQYDQLWQSTVIELEIQREQYQNENRAMHARLSVLADELIVQKRISILQMTLILVCIGLVLFSRGSMHNYLELPLVQSVLSRSPSRRWKRSSTGSPSIDRAMNKAIPGPRASTSILKGHRRILSDESNTAGDDLNDITSLPTPVSFDDFSDAERFRDDVRTDTDLDFDPSTIERPSTSPPVMLSGDEGSSPRSTADSDIDTIETRLLGLHNFPLIEGEGLPQSSLQESTPSKHLTWALPEPQRM